MAEINFKCPFCQQELTAPDTMAGQVIQCPACQQEITVPGGIIETPTETARASMLGDSTSDADKGKTVRIEIPPDVFQAPEKHIFKIKRIQH